MSEHIAIGEQRNRRIGLAWFTSLPSKVVTLSTQVLVLPIVYGVLGEPSFVAYSAIIAFCASLGVLNLGLGGAMVVPISRANAERGMADEARVAQGGVLPLVVCSLVAGIVAIPLLVTLPLEWFFGQYAVGSNPDLRLATILATTLTLAALPLTAVESLRQAYQESHINNIFGTLANILYCLSFYVAASQGAGLTVFVALFCGSMLLGRLLNCLHLLFDRSYLFRPAGKLVYLECRNLLGDGICFVTASLSHVLVYHASIFSVTRLLPVSEAASAIVCLQYVYFPISLAVGSIQPLLASTADANSRGDFGWLRRQLKYGRRAVLILGLVIALITAGSAKQIISLWLRREIPISGSASALMGVYILTALWEYFHFTIAVGLGGIRQASMHVFLRSSICGVLVPLMSIQFGSVGLWIALCLSTVVWTTWRLPILVGALGPGEMASRP